MGPFFSLLLLSPSFSPGRKAEKIADTLLRTALFFPNVAVRPVTRTRTVGVLVAATASSNASWPPVKSSSARSPHSPHVFIESPTTTTARPANSAAATAAGMPSVSAVSMLAPLVYVTVALNAFDAEIAEDNRHQSRMHASVCASGKANKQCVLTFTASVVVLARDTRVLDAASIATQTPLVTSSLHIECIKHTCMGKIIYIIYIYIYLRRYTYIRTQISNTYRLQRCKDRRCLVWVQGWLCVRSEQR